jgi:HD-GYP domain-containing protein (c-di-GMP phosphodiesterase class II)
MTTLLSLEHRILEKGCLEHRPFGEWPNGEKIRDVSGLVIRANVEHLEDVVGRVQGADAGRHAVEELCRLLNDRIPDPAYHVSPTFLRNVWHSYSYEFTSFLSEFCITLSGDPRFQFTMASEKFLSPLIVTLGRPFSTAQIYRMFPHFGEKFAKGSLHFEVVRVAEGTAVLRLRLTDHVTRQFGPYRRACAQLICQPCGAALAAVPKQVHQLKEATVTDRRCMANGDECCEWEVQWDSRRRRRLLTKAAGPVVALMAGCLTVAYLRTRHPAVGLPETLGLALFPAGAAWLASVGLNLAQEAGRRECLIQEQLCSVESKHEELREAYLELEQKAVDLKRIASENAGLYDEIGRAFEGFVRASVTAIESRDPTTSGHSTRVAALSCGLAEAVDRLDSGPYAGVTISAEEMKELRYAALLHDFGKVGVREHILLKAEKLLPEQLTALRSRFALIKTSLGMHALRQKLAVMFNGDRQGTEALMQQIEANFARRMKETDDMLDYLLQCNRPTVMAEGNFARLEEIAAQTFDVGDGPKPYLTSDEVEILSIPRGSLTPADRREIEGHVAATYEFLCAIPWSRPLQNVPSIAYGHHEKLDGGGYPRGLSGHEIPLPTRMMTIGDIYDALTAGDRPYKRAVSPSLALDILQREARAGKLDSNLLRVFVEAKVYERARSGSPA